VTPKVHILSGFRPWHGRNPEVPEAAVDWQGEVEHILVRSAPGSYESRLSRNAFETLPVLYYVKNKDEKMKRISQCQWKKQARLNNEGQIAAGDKVVTTPQTRRQSP
jgi:hypothetical protein